MEVATVVREMESDYKPTPDEDRLWKKLIVELFEEFMLFFEIFQDPRTFCNKNYIRKPLRKRRAEIMRIRF